MENVREYLFLASPWYKVVGTLQTMILNCIASFRTDIKIVIWNTEFSGWSLRTYQLLA